VSFAGYKLTTLVLFTLHRSTSDIHITNAVIRQPVNEPLKIDEVFEWQKYACTQKRN